jgi:hypothetical protein
MGDTLSNDICRARDLSHLPEAQQNACRAAYGEGLRRSMTATALLLLPAAGFFLLTARTYLKDLVAKPG